MAAIDEHANVKERKRIIRVSEAIMECATEHGHGVAAASEQDDRDEESFPQRICKPASTPDEGSDHSTSKRPRSSPKHFITRSKGDNPSSILLLEPFYGGSHAQLIDLLFTALPTCTLIAQQARKWHWRATTSGFVFASALSDSRCPEILFLSSILNLSELLALSPHLSRAKKVVYVHENQINYPIKSQKERDFSIALKEISTFMVADVVLWNSRYNLESYLAKLPAVLNRIPDFSVDEEIVSKIRRKSTVLYFPVEVPRMGFVGQKQSNAVNILWPHRWEHDKRPDKFFSVLRRVKNERSNFKLTILGQGYGEVPQCFEEARIEFKENIDHFGFVESKEEYFEILHRCDVVVSTAEHEFFGVAVLEAVLSGCYPLVPKALVYPEIYPEECCYSTERQLEKRLVRFLKFGGIREEWERLFPVEWREKFSMRALWPEYERCFSVD